MSLAARQRSQQVILCHGVFDLLHLGHIRHLEEAASLGGRLIVSVTADKDVNKGIGRPHFTAEQRVEALKALACVDDVFVSDGPTALSSIQKIKPDIYVKGCDYESADNPFHPFHMTDVAAVEAYGGSCYITRSAKFSSSRLLNAQRFPQSVVDYLDSARTRGFLSKIKQAFERADQLRIVFVGETIIDEYVYVGGLGKPSKESILATVEERKESFSGGVVAASCQTDWANRVVVSPSQTIKKTRYVEQDFSRKLFEVYSRRHLGLSGFERKAFASNLDTEISAADVVVVTDFGHGLIGDDERKLLYDAKFLAVNAQTNAANSGFNPVTLYGSASLFCIDEPEARFAAGMQYGAPDKVAAELCERTSVKDIVITCGRHGCYYGSSEWGAIPAFATQATDTMGAGDAFLATVAPLVAAGLDLEAAAFCGNVAGAIKTTIVGHRTHVTRTDLMQNIEALLA